MYRKDAAVVQNEVSNRTGSRSRKRIRLFITWLSPKKKNEQKILCVDDEPHILEALKRVFRKDFEIYVAAGGEQGLRILERESDFAVIVSDMRMPGISGVEFFNRTKKIAPDTVRIMLTGDAEQQTATNAVNEGEIFRFLTKPCSPEAFGKAVSAAIRQYGLLTMEKDLLEKTLAKSLQVLVDILAVVNPTAFSRASRVKRLARELGERVGDCNVWEIEVAAMLSQIGCVTVPEEILNKIALGEPLEEHELKIYQQHPQIGRSLIADHSANGGDCGNYRPSEPPRQRRFAGDSRNGQSECGDEMRSHFENRP